MTTETSSSLPSGYDTFSAYCSDFIVSSLNSCYGVSLGISANDAMGHAITLWGVDRDDGTGLLTKIYFTDSDDDTTALRSCSLTEKMVIFIWTGTTQRSTITLTPPMA